MDSGMAKRRRFVFANPTGNRTNVDLIRQARHGHGYQSGSGSPSRVPLGGIHRAKVPLVPCRGAEITKTAWATRGLLASPAGDATCLASCLPTCI